MKQALDETQREIRTLANATFGRYSDPERLAKIEASEDAFDAELWAELARAGLLGTPIAEEHGGLGLNLIETALVVEAAGGAVGLVPIAETLAFAWLISTHGSKAQQSNWLPRIAAGDAVIAVAPSPSMAASQEGRAVAVPWAHVADAVLLAPGADAVLATGPFDTAVGTTTARTMASDVPMNRDDVIAGAGSAATAAYRTLLAELSAGVCDGAVRLTASYTSSREQFGKPLSTFQGVALRAADAYIDARAIRSVARQAAWALDNRPEDATVAALTAAWWAAEAGQRCVHATQHLHGGMGADVTYSVHRFFLWGKQIELMLGGGSALLAELGDTLQTVD